MTMYQIFTGFDRSNPDAPAKLLAIMPELVMLRALQLRPEAMRRIHQETANNGVCSLHFNGRQHIDGFGDSVLISLFDENLLKPKAVVDLNDPDQIYTDYSAANLAHGGF